LWFFTSPKITFGEDSLEQLSGIEGKRVLIVTDPVVRKLGIESLSAYLPPRK
jgi:alcohol dehydrogenase class IV